MSEPETQALAAFFERARPDAVLFWDAPATGGQIAPGGCLRINEEAEALAEAYGAVTGYGYNRTNSEDIGSVEGDVTNWLDTKGVPAFFVLLPDVWRADWETNREGILNLLQMVAEG
jgi:hypothetical protein